MIKYYNKIVDDNGYTHSIDNVVAQYMIAIKYDKATELIREMAKDFKLGSRYYEIIDRVPSVKYDFYVNHIHLDYIYIKLGRYKEKMMDVKSSNVSYEVVDYMSVEVNPNKHYDTDLFNSFMSFVRSVECGSNSLKRVDYAVDIPVVMKNIIPCNTRKTKGLFKGTTYFGNRNNNGFVRIYDKAKESELDEPLTRVESVVKFGKKDKFSSIDFGVVTGGSSESDEKLTPTLSVLVKALRDIRLEGGDITDYLSGLDRRTRAKIEPLIVGNVKTYKSNPDILNELLKSINELFCLENTSVKPMVYEDDEGFLTIDCNDFDEFPF